MAKIDEIYKDLVNTIIDEGEMEVGDVRPKYADGTPAYTKRIYGVNLKLKADEGLPILQSKKVAMKSFKAEIDWIFRLMSNDVRFLNELGSKVWDSWKLEDGTIGPAYGAQLANKKRLMRVREDWMNPKASGPVVDRELNQVEYVLHEIMHNPRSRRIITNLFEVGDIQDMALAPCVFMTSWQVGEDNKLHLVMTQRSADVALKLAPSI